MKATDNKIIRKTFQASETKAAGDNSRQLTVVISTNTPDRSNDVMVPEGMVVDNYLKNPVVAFGHNYSGVSIGKTVALRPGQDNVEADLEFTPAGVVPLADQCAELYKGGFMNAWSIGFIPLEFEDRPDGGRTYTKWELLEFSAVLVPDNPEALTVLRSKGIDEDIIKQGTDGPEDPQPTDPEPTGTETDEPKSDNPTDEPEQKEIQKKDVAETVALADVIGYLNWITSGFEQNGVKEEVVSKLKDALSILMEVLKAEAVVGQKQFSVEGKEGRVLSEANRKLVNSTIESLKTAEGALKDLLDASESKDVEISEVKDLDSLIALRDSFRKTDKNIGITLRDLNEAIKNAKGGELN